MDKRAIDFIKFLYSSKLVDLAVIKEDSEDGFVNRLRLQRLIYLAQECFDLNLGYEYSAYRYGPYFPRLAYDYFEIDMNSVRSDSNPYTLPLDFNEEEFLSIFSDRDEGWLELAATLIDSANYNERTEDVVSTVSRIKVNYQRSEIQEVYNDLLHNGLMDYQ